MTELFITNICQGCLSSNDLINIAKKHNTDDNMENYIDMFMHCFNIKVGIDNPEAAEWLCKNCINSLTSSYKFKTVVIASQEFLKEQKVMMYQHASEQKCEDSEVSENKPSISKTDTIDIKLEPIDYIYTDSDISKVVHELNFETMDHDMDLDLNFDEIEEKPKKAKLHNISARKSKQNKLDNVDYRLRKSCPLCKDVFMFSHLYHEAEHMKNIHNVDIELPKDGYVITCHVCDTVYDSVLAKEIHIKKKHKQIDITTIKLNKKLHRCKICKICFHTGIAKESHLNDEHNLQYSYRNKSTENIWKYCELCGTQLRHLYDEIEHLYNVHKIDKVKELVPERGIILKCDDCGEILKSCDAKSKHLIFVHGYNTETIKNVKNVGKCLPRCQHCGVYFKCVSTRNMHLTESHGVERIRLQCEVCGADFNSMQRLRSHISVVHVKRVVAVCDVCNKTFTRKEALRRHMPKHTGIRAYPCLECGKAYKKSYTLKQHMKIHLGVKNFVCNICGMAFTYKCSLKNHMEKQH